MKNDFNYKWSKLFASKRYKTKDGVIKLTPEEQQELLDDSESLVKNCSKPDVSVSLLNESQRELLSQYNDFVNVQYHGVSLDDSDINDFNYWLNGANKSV